ncbi:MAG: flavoprotein [Duodenibacillus massiliensis]
MPAYPTLKNRSVTLAVTGGIAAYKSCELVRLLKKAGADVRVIMTEAAAHFVTPLTFEERSAATPSALKTSRAICRTLRPRTGRATS